MQNLNDGLKSPRAPFSAEQREMPERRVPWVRDRSHTSSPIPRLPDGAGSPLSFAQERLLFLHQVAPQSAAYNRPACFRLTGALDRQLLERCLQEISRRHTSLRTRIHINADGPYQTVVDDVSIPLEVDDLCHLGASEREEAARRITFTESQRPFTLVGETLVRGRLVKLAEEEHLLLLIFHHAIFDAWSEQVLRSELARLYDALRAGRPSPLPDLSIQFRDYAAWQRDAQHQASFETQLAYWRDVLNGAPRVLELPIDHPRPAEFTDRGAKLVRMLPAELASDIRELSRQEETTLFITLLTAFNLLVHRCTGRDDFLIGTPVAGRSRVELEPLVGLFINMLPLRTRVADDETFRSLLSKTQSIAFAAFAHEEVPFDKLVDALETDRSASYSPLIQATFQTRNVPQSRENVPELAIEPYAAECCCAQFDLSFEVTESGNGLECAIIYSTDLFDADTIHRMLSHYEHLLRQIAADPDVPVASISLLTPAEWSAFHESVNALKAYFPVEKCLHELIEEQAVRSPAAVAVTCGEESLTYAALNARANQLARVLRKRGAGPDQLVAIALDRSLDAVVGILAILKSGAAYVPLDVAHPPERLQMLIDDAEPVALLTTEGLFEQLRHSSAAATAICLDSDRALIDHEETDDLENTAVPSNLAYVIYTSGSTGKPKGVMVEHRNVVRLFDATHPVFQFCERDVWTIFHSFAFDFSVWELFGPLTTGGRAVVVPRDIAKSPSDFLELLHREQVTILNQTPSAFRHLDMADAAAGRFTTPSVLRLVIFGGEALEPAQLAGWFDRHGDDLPQLVNMYGITETTVHVTLRRITRADLAHPGRSVIGVPIDDLKVLLLDQNGQPVPDGVPGEMYVGGAGVARGYLNRPDLTEVRFPRDMFDSGDPDRVDRLYRSGDLARRRANGELEYLGRIDQQVQIRGFRVEPGEIDAALRAHPEIANSAVMPHNSSDGVVTLIAYVVCHPGRSVAVDELADSLRKSLPEHMIPSSFVFLSSLPLTVNGKLDRAALPLPGSERPELQERYIAPATSNERELAAIWSELLHIETIGTRDNFFALGGHSLVAVQLVSRVRERLFRELPLRQVFDSPTVAGLAAYLDLHRNDADPSLPKVVPVLRGEPLPLSLSQEQFAILAELHPDAPLYNETLALRISGPLDFSLLVRSLNTIVNRHEVLRTTITTENGEFVQQIQSHASLPLSMVDLSFVSAGEREDEAMRLADEDARRMFNLRTGPMVRATLFRIDDETHLLCLTNHHIVGDRISSYLLTNELAALYDAFSRNAPSPLAPLTVQYADYAVWQRERLLDESAMLDARYWTWQLAGAVPLSLPVDRKRTLLTTSAGKRKFIDLPSDLFESLTEYSRGERTTPFVTLLAAFKALLSRYCGQNDVAIGTVFSDREQDELRGIVGCFLNTVVLRTDLDGDPTFRELVGRVQKTTIDAVAHRRVPFVTLMEHLQQKNRSDTRNPLFNVAFVLEPLEEIADAKWSLNHRKGYSGTSKFDLMLLIDQRAHGNFAVLEYNTDLFDGETAGRMLEHFLILLRGALEDPELPVSQLPLLSDHERERQLVEWNDQPGSAGPLDVCLHELFEQQVLQTPDAAAVAFEEESLTYAELNQRANRVARELIAIGVGAESLVALCVERSLDLIVGMLGILKAGGAYVPLDPAQPTGRLDSMLDDCAATAIVTQSALAARFESRSTPLLRLDVVDFTVGSANAGNPTSRVASENLAYIIYTSGSTGRPKGVAVEHRQIVNYVRGILERIPFAAGSSFATVSTIAADLGNTVVFPSLCTGGVLHVISSDRASDPHALSEYFSQHPIDCLKIVPSHLNALMAGSNPETLMPKQFLILGGEASRCEWVARLQRLAPRTTIINHYGPTETTVGVLTNPVGPDELSADSGMLPLGHPLPNTQAYILDKHLQPTPLGIAGDLYIGGAGVARGYLNRPDLIAASFIPDPFRNEPGARLYRTGDRARYLADGHIEFLGRADNQVKIRGFRIELGEVEAALREHPGVSDAVVLATEPEEGDRRLAAYVVPCHAPAETLNGRRTYRLANKLRVLQINKNETDYIYHEVFELQAYMKHGITLRDADIVFDVGANIGLFTLFADRVCREARIFSFEPNPVVFEALQANAAENARNVTAFNFGLSSRNDTAEFTFFEGFSLLSGYYADADAEREVVKQYLHNQTLDGSEGAAEFEEHADELLKQRFTAKTFTTELRTLSSVIEAEQVERIDLLKINVEKSELDVLLGIGEDDWPKIAQLVVEIDVPEHRNTIVALLESHGYDVLVEQDRLLSETPLCYAYAIRPTAGRKLIRGQADGAHLREILPVSDNVPTAAELQEHLRRILPDYMVPDAIVTMNEFPLTPNGKLDRQQLSAFDGDRNRLSEPFVAPRTPLEEMLAATWQNVLHVDRVGINDNFFELGGHSLLAMRVAARLRSEFNLELPVRTLFESPTVVQLAVVMLGELVQKFGAEV